MLRFAKSLENNETVPANGRGGAWWMALCLAAVTLATFWRATQCDFVNYDDPTYVTENSDVQEGLTADSVRRASAVNFDGLRIPLTCLSHMADWQIYRDSAWGHHLTNILLHTANTVLLFLLLRFMTGSLWRSAFVAALFALHPLHVETAAWVSERKGVLSTLFWLLALWAYARYARFTVEGLKQAQARSSYAMALVLFACALMAKPIVVTLPFVLLLLDYWPLERWKPSHASQGWRALVKEKIPFFLLAGIGSLVTFCEAPAEVLTAGQRISNALISYPRYLGKTIWPFDLAIPYPHPANWPGWGTMLAAAFLTITTGLVIWQARRRAYLAMGWFWFLGTLVPVLGLVRMGFYSIADRYTYVSLIGVFVMLAWATGEIPSRWNRWRRATVAGAMLLLCLCAWRAHDQLRHWQNSGTLFSHALQATKNNFLAHNNLGSYLYSRGRHDEAMKHYVEAVNINPQYNLTWENIFCALADTRLDRQAIAHYTQTLKSKTNAAAAPAGNWNTMGFATFGAAIGALFLKAILRTRRAHQEPGLDRSKDSNPLQE
ncbi:MAG: tetratricopeptide repeat protein [Verrucomicrobia bacterium]|nr:tetratricopeptide repeat protein [Verrucomicrobiota bacterium]